MISASPIKFLVANQNICTCLGTNHSWILTVRSSSAQQKILNSNKNNWSSVSSKFGAVGSHKMPAINSPLSLDFITSPTTAIWLKIILFGNFLFRTKVNRNVQEREADRKLAENTESAKDRSEVRRARGPGGLDIVRHLY